MKRLEKIIILISLMLVINNIKVFSQTEEKKFENGDVLISYIGTYQGGNFTISKEPYSNYLLGVYFDENKTEKRDPRYFIIPIKTKGITYVKYTNENGEIHKGDPVTSSNIPGVAMKATEPGMILGVALEDATNPNGLVKIRVLIQYLR